MKNLLAFLLSGIFLVSLVNCSDDDDPNISLEGTTWLGISFVATNCTDPTDNEPLSNYTCTVTDCETILLESGSFSVTTIDDGTTDVMSGTYTISGNVLSVALVMEDENVTFDILYSINGDILTFDFTDPAGCDIIQKWQAVSNSN